jgi:hypothetical protein
MSKESKRRAEIARQQRMRAQREREKEIRAAAAPPTPPLSPAPHSTWKAKIGPNWISAALTFASCGVAMMWPAAGPILLILAAFVLLAGIRIEGLSFRFNWVDRKRLGQVIIGLLIMVCAFGGILWLRSGSKTDLNFFIYGLGSAPAITQQGIVDGSTVLVEMRVTNLGTLQTTMTTFGLTADINDRTYIGKALHYDIPIIAQIRGKQKIYDPTVDLIGRKFVLAPGIPISGNMVFHFDDAPIAVFSNRVLYHFEITDSFGRIYHFDKETHGELTEPNPPLPPNIDTPVPPN